MEVSITEQDSLVPDIRSATAITSAPSVVSRERINLSASEVITTPWVAAIATTRRAGLTQQLYTRLIKRWVDVVASLVLLFILSPILIVIALLIVVDTPGSPLFVQQRVGKSGCRFKLYKFRTMAKSNNDQVMWFEDEFGQKRHKIRNDPRVTRVGKWLRRTSLDEFPQFLNILKGDMSFIGPRPELVSIVETYEPWQHERHLVKPGLTGWWQVSGRSDKPMHENTELDIFYVRGQSIRLDAMIALKTIRVVFKGFGAF